MAAKIGSKVTAKVATKAAAKMATKTGGTVASQLGVGLIDPIVGVGNYHVGFVGLRSHRESRKTDFARTPCKLLERCSKILKPGLWQQFIS